MTYQRPFFFLIFITGFLTFLSAFSFAEEDIHAFLFEETDYPSAKSCQICHPLHYKEWSVSPHAYAVISPVNNSMQARITQLTNGTNGDFCMRCHTPVGLDMGEAAFMSSMDRHPVSREGVSCIVCHRRNKAYGKVSARFSVIKGDIFEPVYGSHSGEELKRVIESGEYDVVAERGQEGRAIHAEAREFFQIKESGFCGSCHDVNHFNGFRLEEAFSEYKSSPAAEKGVSCQDCHMGKEPGLPSGYYHEPIAIVAGKPTMARKRTNHMFVGPDYSIVHPGIFPHNPEAQDIASMREWLKFNVGAGWGEDDFEDEVEDDYEFPERWADASDRYEAREIINQNLELLAKADEERQKLLSLGYQLGDVDIQKVGEDEIKFRVEVRNGTDGHNVPTGFDAERIVFLRINVMDKNGKVVFRSGDLDPNGDLRDSHSRYVHDGVLPKDKHLFNLQSKFITRMVKGGEREQVLAVNYSPSPLPFIRPAVQSTLLLGRPTGSRKHRKTIPPFGSHWADYKLDASDLKDSQGPYRVNVKLIAGMVPVNLIYEIQKVGFDYDMSPREIADLIVEGHQVLWEKEFELKEGLMEAEPLEGY